jgi:alanyl-tRNA synthetase
MGDTGPCGPCSEIFWDNGPEIGCGRPECAVGCDCDRYMEIWNNVFMQFNRSADGTLTPLPKPSVDTGMGLERICTVMQGVKSNYDTDLLRGIIAYIEQLSGSIYRGSNSDSDVSMRVIADHSRATAYLIADGVMPANEGRGYVLRRIMRRAMRHAKMLGFDDPVLFKTAVFVLESMAGAYPEEAGRKEFVAKVVKNEEERFIQTLGNGLRILEEEVAKLRAANQSLIPGATVFKLYDTFGFPVDLTADIVEKDGFSLDHPGFEACMAEQRKKAREHWKGSGEETIAAVYRQLLESGIKSEFIGYQATRGDSTIRALIKDGEPIDQAVAGDEVEVITSLTPFYGESGGQVGDRGSIVTPGAKLDVTDTLKPLTNLTVHVARVTSGTLKIGEAADLLVDADARQATALNHTATHILQAVLIEVLGNHVKQAGSLVGPERLRFDFTHFSAMSEAELETVERLVNERIRQNRGVQVEEMSADDAIAAGATALFGEKYGDRVRVVSVGDFSMELCGGTHTHAAGDIGLFKIIQESGIAAGVRRIEAATGARALEIIRQQEAVIEQAATLLKSDSSQLESRIRKLLEHQRELERQVESLRGKLQSGQAGQLLDAVREVSGVKILAVKVDSMDGRQLREMADQLRDKLGSGVLVIGCEQEGKANLLVAVSKDLTDRLHAGNLIRRLAELVGGKGGGRPDLAQAGGSNPQQLQAALDLSSQLVKEQLS